jgi:uncharacterized protein with HEPN domain
MAARSPLLRIHDMLESIRGIEKAIAGKTFRDYQRSWLLRSAIERGIEVISEASRHLGRDLKAQHDDVRSQESAIFFGMSISTLTQLLFGGRLRTTCQPSKTPCSP